MHRKTRWALGRALELGKPEDAPKFTTGSQVIKLLLDGKSSPECTKYIELEERVKARKGHIFQFDNKKQITVYAIDK